MVIRKVLDEATWEQRIEKLMIHEVCLGEKNHVSCRER